MPAEEIWGKTAFGDPGAQHGEHGGAHISEKIRSSARRGDPVRLAQQESVLWIGQAARLGGGEDLRTETDLGNRR